MISRNQFGKQIRSLPRYNYDYILLQTGAYLGTVAKDAFGANLSMFLAIKPNILTY